MSGFAVRTDLALEVRESIDEEEQSLRGVEVEEYTCLLYTSPSPRDS